MRKHPMEMAMKPEMHHSGKSARPESMPAKSAAMKDAQGSKTKMKSKVSNPGDSGTVPNIGKAVSHLKKQAMESHYMVKK